MNIPLEYSGTLGSGAVNLDINPDATVKEMLTAFHEAIPDNDSIAVASVAFSRKDVNDVVQQHRLDTYFKNVNNRYFPVYIITETTSGDKIKTKYITTTISFSEADVLELSSRSLIKYYSIDILHFRFDFYGFWLT